MVPFSLVLLGLLIVSSLFVRIRNDLQVNRVHHISKKAYVYGVLLAVVLLTVFRVLPILSGFIVIVFALIFG